MHSSLAALPTAPRERLAGLLALVKSLQAKGADGLTDSDVALVPELKADLEKTEARVKGADALASFGAGRERRWQNLDGSDAGRIGAGHSSGTFESRTEATKGFGEALTKALESNPQSLHTKSGVLPASGTTTRFAFDQPLIAADRGPLVLADLVQRVGSDVPSGTQLVQSLRTNNPAAVVVGDVKPLSDYQLSPRTWRVGTVAHRVNVPAQYLADYAGIAEFLQAELAYGLAEAVDRAIALGTTDEEGQPAPGLLSAATAIPAQAFAADALTSIRSAVGALDRQGTASTGIALNPDDWQAFELLRENGNTGAFLLPQAPSARAPRLLFGLPVVLSNTIPAGTGIVGDWSRAAWIERQTVTVEAFEAGLAREGSGTGSSVQHAQDLASRNLVAIRAELRGTPLVQAPGAFRKVALAAA